MKKTVEKRAVSKQKPPRDAPMNPRKDMGILEHIEDLRKHLLVVVIALVVATGVCIAFAEEIIHFLAVPVGGVGELISLEVTENIAVFMRVSLLGGFILAFPFIYYVLMFFIWPGLERPGERVSVVLISLGATVLFVGGVAFAYYVMLPPALDFLLDFIDINTTPRLMTYYEFVTNLLFWIGMAFETPLLIYILARFGLVTPRLLVRGWRIAVVAIAVLAAVITPTPDPFNMGLVMLPMIVLYAFSIAMAAIAARTRRAHEEATPDGVQAPEG